MGPPARAKDLQANCGFAGGLTYQWMNMRPKRR